MRPHLHRVQVLPCVVCISLCFASLADAQSDALRKTAPVQIVNALADGATLCTAAIQKQIDTAAAAGGGTVHLAKGRYLTGTLELKDGVTLDLAEGAVLLGSTRGVDYPPMGAFVDGVNRLRDRVLISARHVKNVGITGAGIIDGQSDEIKELNPKPFLVRFEDCDGVTIKNITLARSGSWTCHLWGSRNVTVQGVTILPQPHGANNDGIDIDSSQNVVIRDCRITSNDDAICFKATVNQPCRNVQVSHCTMNTVWNGFKIGTESMGDFEDITMTDCNFERNASGGIRIYSVDGANIRRIRVENIRIGDSSLPIYIRLGARLHTFRKGDAARPVGSIEDVVIRNISGATHGQAVLFVSGIPGHPVRKLHLENIDCSTPGGLDGKDLEKLLPEKESTYPEPYTIYGRLPAYGLYFRHVAESDISQVSIECEKADLRHAVVCEDVQNVRLTKLGFKNPAAAPAADLRLRGSACAGIQLHNWNPRGIVRDTGVSVNQPSLLP